MATTNVNAGGFYDLSKSLNYLVKMAMSDKPTTAVEYQNFVSVANIVKNAGTDNLTNSIDNLISRTLFSSRPYYAKFKDLMMGTEQFGSVVRKLQTYPIESETNQEYDLVDGTSVDPYKIKKPKTMQTFFNGATTRQVRVTTYKHQLDTAFNSPAELRSFISMLMQEVANSKEAMHEATARATLANAMGTLEAGKATMPRRARHLETEYKALNSLQSITDIPAFIKWVFVQINKDTQMMTERTDLFSNKFTAGRLPKHTPLADQRFYMLTENKLSIDTEVLADVYHDNRLTFPKSEMVNFWQTSGKPDQIKGKFTYVKNDGKLAPEVELDMNNVFAVLLDKEFAGMTVVNQWSASTPLNAAAGYYNTFWHWTERYYNDPSENGVVYFLD